MLGAFKDLNDSKVYKGQKKVIFKFKKSFVYPHFLHSK